MRASVIFLFSLLALILPLGLDTLGVSLSLGMRTASQPLAIGSNGGKGLPIWVRTATLFALAEMLMPIVGLLIGAALSSLLSEVMHYVGALLLIGIGLWECAEEGREYLNKRKKRLQGVDTGEGALSPSASAPQPVAEHFQWSHQIMLALSVSLDELAVGFSFGSVKNITISPFTLCLFIGLQGFFMAILGLALGRTLRFRLKTFKEWSELLSAALLIALGVWFLFM